MKIKVVQGALGSSCNKDNNVNDLFISIEQ